MWIQYILKLRDTTVHLQLDNLIDSLSHDQVFGAAAGTNLVNIVTSLLCSIYYANYFSLLFFGCMSSTRSQGEKLEQPIDEIERLINLRRIIKEYQLKYNIPDLNIPEPDMVANQNCPLKDYAAPSEKEPYSSIPPPAIEVNNFELKPSLLQVMQHNQFYGSPTEDSNLHLLVFVQYADTLKANDIDPEAIRLCLFPFSLRDGVRAWLQSLPSNSITT